MSVFAKLTSVTLALVALRPDGRWDAILGTFDVNGNFTTGKNGKRSAPIAFDPETAMFASQRNAVHGYKSARAQRGITLASGSTLSPKQLYVGVADALAYSTVAQSLRLVVNDETLEGDEAKAVLLARIIERQAA